MGTDNFSTVRAVWDVYERQLVQDANYPTSDKIIASFMHFQDCYVFMKGLAVANGHKFKDFHPDSELKTKSGHTSYFYKIRNVYIGDKSSRP